MNFLSNPEAGKLPAGFAWLHEPGSYEIEDGRLSVNPQTGTDLFRPPDGGPPSDNPCLLYTEMTGDFTAVAHLRADLVGFGDAGAVVVRISPVVWAKVCMERSPLGEIGIVSVVTRGLSDDSNGELLENPECWLRLTRRGEVYGMHHSLDGETWRFTRTFTFAGAITSQDDTVQIGIQAQAPFAAGCHVEFDYFAIEPRAVPDFRSGV